MIRKTFIGTLAAGMLACGAAHAWDHPGHMTTAVIAFEEIKRERPDLIQRIGDLLLKHPDPAPFWVAAEDTRGEERIKRMFIEAARWPDDAKFTLFDQHQWHTARWAIVKEDAPPKSRELVEKRGGKTAGAGIEALTLNAAVLADPESRPNERALALSWVLHIIGDLHQPLHTADLFSKQFPTGNTAGALGWVEDPLRPTSGMPLHVLWDSHSRRSSQREDVDRYAREVVKAYPRSALPELTPFEGAVDFEKWTKESYHEAVDWVYDLDVIADPETDPEIMLAKIMEYIRDGVSPIEGAPTVPAEYWEKTQEVATRRLALAGYRIADLILAAADRIETERSLAGQALDSVHIQGSTKD